MSINGPAVEIRLLDPATHDRGAFNCGSDRLDNYLQRTARTRQKGDFVLAYVAVTPAQYRVLNFHSVDTHALAADDLGPLAPKATPSHEMMPAIYLPMIAVDVTHQGRSSEAPRSIIPSAKHLGSPRPQASGPSCST